VLILLIIIIIKKYGNKIKEHVTEFLIKIPKWNFHNLLKDKYFWIILSVIYILFGFYLYFNPEIITTATSVQFATLIVILIGLILFRYYIIPKQYSHWLISIVSTLFLAFVLIWLFLIQPFSLLFLQGDVTIEMENIYYKTGDPIPVTIHLTGPNTGLLINLTLSD
jgi:hypothetical protein